MNGVEELDESYVESPAKLTARLEGGLADALGYEVPVFLRSAKELLALKICDMACGSGAFLVQARGLTGWS